MEEEALLQQEDVFLLQPAQVAQEAQGQCPLFYHQVQQLMV
jgi:hypothetical protein